MFWNNVLPIYFVLPAIFLIKEEVWDIRLDERDFRKAISLGGTTWEGEDAFIEVNVDTLKMWQAVVMTDPRGGEWRTVDAVTWSNGLDSFEMPVMEG